MTREADGSTSSAADRASRLAPPAVSYIAGVIGVSTLAGILALVGDFPASFAVVAVWVAAALVGELLTFSTATNRAHINLATTMHLAMILTLPLGSIVAVLWISRSVAKFILKRQEWYRAWFNVSQVTGAMIAAATVYRLLGGTLTPEFTLGGLVRLGPAFAAAALTYYALNIGSVSGIVALTSNLTWWRAWRENYGYAAEVASTGGLMLMAPVAALCYTHLGAAGLTVFVVPLFFIRASSVRYIALRQTQERVIAAERLAAKGEIAAEVGHEINNYLQGVYGNLQLMLLGEDGRRSQGDERLTAVMENLKSIAALSRGLVESSTHEADRTPIDLNRVLGRTVSFLEPQSRFDGIHIELDLDERLALVPADALQIQQVAMNLVINAANAVREAGVRAPRIQVWSRLHDVSGLAEFGVSDNGPGVPHDVRNRIFEPGFTTRRDGHGFGLATVHAAVKAHQGAITVEDAPLGGAQFRVTLPLHLGHAPADAQAA